MFIRPYNNSVWLTWSNSMEIVFVKETLLFKLGIRFSYKLSAHFYNILK